MSAIDSGPSILDHSVIHTIDSVLMSFDHAWKVDRLEWTLSCLLLAVIGCHTATSSISIDGEAAAVNSFLVEYQSASRRALAETPLATH